MLLCADVPGMNVSMVWYFISLHHISLEEHFVHLASFAYTLLTDIYIVKLRIGICFIEDLLINLTSVWLHTTQSIHLNETAIESRGRNTLAVDSHSAHSISF